MTTEATLDLGAYCPSGSTSCSSECKATVTRLSGLSCIGDISGSLGASYSDAVSLCCDNKSIECPAGSGGGGLSPGGKAGIAIAIILIFAAASGGAVFYFRKRGFFKKEHVVELKDKRRTITFVM